MGVIGTFCAHNSTRISVYRCVPKQYTRVCVFFLFYFRVSREYRVHTRAYVSPYGRSRVCLCEW
jgi:hypothetical protein